jgi:hypothetical protein
MCFSTAAAVVPWFLLLLLLFMVFDVFKVFGVDDPLGAAAARFDITEKSIIREIRFAK